MSHQLPPDWPMPQEYLTELGRITAMFSSLEYGVNLSISKLSGHQGMLDWRSAVVTAHANFKQRVDILETLCHELCLEGNYPHLKNYKNVLDKIKQVQAKRNRYMHDSLGFDNQTGKLTSASISARGKLATQVKEVTIEEMKELSAQIHVVQVELFELITNVKTVPVWER